MSEPLLGPYRLTARTFASSAGVVYAAVDPAGRPLNVVVLTTGAASDAAARDRFAAAIRASSGELLAGDPRGPAPWAAGGPGVARLLDPVLLPNGPTGPTYLPHWIGAESPALPHYAADADNPAFGGYGVPRQAAPPPEEREGVRRFLVVLVTVLATLLVLGLIVGLLLWWLFATVRPPRDLDVPPSRPPSPTQPEPSPGSPQPTPQQPGPGPSPTPGPSGPPTPGGTPTPGPTGPSPGTTEGPGDGGELV